MERPIHKPLTPLPPDGRAITRVAEEFSPLHATWRMVFAAWLWSPLPLISVVVPTQDYDGTLLDYLKNVLRMVGMLWLTGSFFMVVFGLLVVLPVVILLKSCDWAWKPWRAMLISSVPPVLALWAISGFGFEFSVLLLAAMGVCIGIPAALAGIRYRETHPMIS